jgi:hypothetical protein
MSKSTKRSKGAAKKTAPTTKSAPNPALRMWLIRGTVAVLLVSLLGLALLDFKSKQEASTTAAGWREALRSKDEMKELNKSAFKKLPVSGLPTITSFQSATRSATENSTDTYAWKGIFRTYSVKVAFGLGNDPPVESIDGP